MMTAIRKSLASFLRRLASAIDKQAIGGGGGPTEPA